MNNKLDWNDIEVFLTVAKSGSLSQAARILNRSQPTIGRRIEAIENILHITLFQRTPYGYAITEMGQQLLTEAQTLVDNIESFKNKARSLQTLQKKENVTIASGESFARLLMLHMHEFVAINQNISLEMTTGFSFLNIEKGEADIAIRSQRPKSPNLVTRQLGKCLFAIYCSKSYLDKFPDASQPFKSGAQNNWVAYKDDQADLPSTQWMKSKIDDRNIKIRCNNPSTLLLSIKNGHGLALIPRFIGEMEPELIQLSPVLEDIKPDIWLVLSRNAHRVPSIKQVANWVSQTFEQQPNSVVS
jgi:DNA-binding transcriptional LysR family regulator